MSDSVFAPADGQLDASRVRMERAERELGEMRERAATFENRERELLVEIKDFKYVFTAHCSLFTAHKYTFRLPHKIYSYNAEHAAVRLRILYNNLHSSLRYTIHCAVHSIGV